MEHLERAGAVARRIHRMTFGGAAAALAAVPGRVNLIGEHVDHAGGPVLPVAIDLATAVAAGPGHPGLVRLANEVYGRIEVEVTDEIPPGGGPTWARAIIAAAIGQEWDIAGLGLDVSIASDIPPGAGLSSSAAFLVAAVLATGPARDPGPPEDPTAAARMARRLEHEVLGVPCGPMDQLAAIHGRAGHAVSIDCRPGGLDPTPIALPPNAFCLMFVDTGLRHSLADGRYASRRTDLARAATTLGIDPGDWNAAADSPPDLRALARVDPPAAARARHVITEICRTRAAVAMLRAGDARGFGVQLDASHASLRDDFDASMPGVEAVRTIIRHALGPELLGCRMVGGGWGGGIVCLTRAPIPTSAIAAITRRGAAATGRPPSVRPIHAADGARHLDPLGA